MHREKKAIGSVGFFVFVFFLIFKKAFKQKFMAYDVSESRVMVTQKMHLKLNMLLEYDI